MKPVINKTFIDVLKIDVTSLKIEIIYFFPDQDSRALKGNAHEFMWIPGHRVGAR